MKFKTVLLFLTNLLSYTIHGQTSQLADSIIYTNDNRVLAQVFNYEKYYHNDDGLYREFRFYNEEGFYCLSVLQGEDGLFQHGYTYNDPILIEAVDPDKDLIFVSDSFDTSFIVFLNNIADEDFYGKYDKAIEYFYQVPDYHLDSTIVQYLDSNVYSQFDLQDTVDDSIRDTLTAEDDEAKEVIFSYHISIRIPDLTHSYRRVFSGAILSSIHLSKSEKRRNNHKLYFRIESDNRGRIEELKFIGDISNRKEKRLRKVLEELKKMPLIIHRTTRLKLKAVFYVEFE